MAVQEIRKAARRRYLFADSQQHAQVLCVVGEVSIAPAVPAADGLLQQASLSIILVYSPGEIETHRENHDGRQCEGCIMSRFKSHTQNTVSGLLEAGQL